MDAGMGTIVTGNAATDSERTRQQLEALAALAQLGPDQTERAILQAGADIAQRCTSSRIAYFHLLNDDEETIELGAWSADTSGYCTATYDRHYPVSQAGIWADTARTRRPVIHNDYPAVSGKRGLPDGHSRLDRHLGVPIENEGAVRLLLGVGNKDLPYDEDDVRTVTLVGERCWELLRHRREVERLQDLERRFHNLKRLAAVSAWEYDPELDRLTWDDMFRTLFLVRSRAEVPVSLGGVLPFFAPRDRPRVRAALTGHRAGARFGIRLFGTRATGESFAAELKGEVRAREVGDGVVVVGMLQDLSERARVEDLRHDAETDPLTELPNRRRLNALFATGPLGRRGPRDGVAVLYVDLDAFKPVNDSLGHAAGDEVLRIIARRLAALVRRDDLVARLGGDEFVIVQGGLADAAGATTLAAKVVEACAEPIAIEGQTVQVGASVGIATCPTGRTPLAELAARADRALYEAKQAGRNRYVLSPA